MLGLHEAIIERFLSSHHVTERVMKRGIPHATRELNGVYRLLSYFQRVHDKQSNRNFRQEQKLLSHHPYLSHSQAFLIVYKPKDHLR